ncbi:MAG TPA: methyltransferase domain-containing protein [Arenibacter sp.]|nr:methyltransferase domain-containing protein [Arenibacter sp.]
MNFRDRSKEPEIMDDPNLDLAALKKVFVDINKVNKVLNGYFITLKALEKMLDENPQSGYTLMDLGCGDGDMLKQIALYFKDRPISLNLIGVDLNGNAIKIAMENCMAFPNISFLQKDILSLEVNTPQCDILLCTLTMHHFGKEEIPVFLQRIVQLSQIGIIINDLQRSRVSYYLFKIFSVIFIKTHIARYDGLISIKRAFAKSELKEYSKIFPHLVHQIRWKWAFRYLWVMQIKRE